MKRTPLLRAFSVPSPSSSACRPLSARRQRGATARCRTPRAKKAVVLLFIARDCPISNSYVPEIERIIARDAREKVAFILVSPDPDTTLASARQHARDYGYTCPLLLDPAHRLAHRAGATVTPAAALFAPGGRLLYRGRIDDLFLGFGKRRDAAARHDLRDALTPSWLGVPLPASRDAGRRLLYLRRRVLVFPALRTGKGRQRNNP